MTDCTPETTATEPIHVYPFPRADGWAEHTGEVIVEVRCHGEVWRASNWRGRLSDGE